jgi:hypothetical protein
MALVTHSTAIVAGRQKFNPFYQPMPTPPVSAQRRGRRRDAHTPSR